MPQPKKPPSDTGRAAAKGGKAEFPKDKLEDALALPEALQRNGGHPLVHRHRNRRGRSPGSSTFRTLTASSTLTG